MNSQLKRPTLQKPTKKLKKRTALANGLIITIPAGNVRDFNNYFTIMKSLAEVGTDIPAVYVKNFFRLMGYSNTYNHDKIYNEATEYAIPVVQKIITCKGYDFVWHDTKQQGADVTVHNDTPKIITEIIYHFLVHSQKPYDKDYIVSCIYQLLEKYYSDLIDVSQSNPLTVYKMSVIAGYCTISLGYKLTTNKNPSNSEIFHATRNAIKSGKKNSSPKF